MNAAIQPNVEEATILFEEGLIGVPQARRFHILERPGSAIRLLRCVDVPGLTLPVVEPHLADPEYRPEFGHRVSEALGTGEEDQFVLLAVATLEEGGATANLRAPLVINVSRRVGMQVILDSNSYSLRETVRTSP